MMRYMGTYLHFSDREQMEHSEDGKELSQYPLKRNYNFKGRTESTMFQIILILLLSFALNIKPNPVRKIITIGIANNTTIKAPKPVSSATSNREKGIAIKEMRMPIIIRIIPTTFRIGLGINSNNKSTITTFPNC